MVALKFIYRSRQALRLACSAVIVWLAVSVVLALVPKGKVNAGNGATSVTGILRSLTDSVLAAVALPGCSSLFCSLLRRLSTVEMFGGGTRSGASAGSCVRRHGAGLVVSARWRLDSGGGATGPLSMVTTSSRGQKAYPPSLQNFVAACARCNGTKGARIPFARSAAKDRSRRLEYGTPEGAISVGARRRLSGAA